MATISDVAKLANVSISTVSYAISGKRSIRADTRKRVRDAMETLNFSPNVHARRLAGNRSEIIALLCPPGERLLGHSEMSLVSGALTRAQAGGFQMLIWMLEVADVPALTRHLSQGLVDGLMVMEVHMEDPRVDLLRDAGLPFVMLGRNRDNAELDFIDTDFNATVRMSIDYLGELGHRTVAFVNQSDDVADAGYGPVVRAEAAMRTACRDASIDLIVHRTKESREAGARAYRACVAQNANISAVVTLNEPATVGLIAAAMADGRDIPHDLSVLSLTSSTLIAEMSTVMLTTCGPDLADIGRAGADLLLRRLDGLEGPPVQTLLQSLLTIRQSTASVAQREGARPNARP